jgi:hypothetical protein
VAVGSLFVLRLQVQEENLLPSAVAACVIGAAASTVTIKAITTDLDLILRLRLDYC